jgi:hypothetical protein
MAVINLDTSQVLDITCKRGDTFSMTVNLKDSSGTALALSTNEYEFIVQVKPTNSTRDTDIVLTTPNAVGFDIVVPDKRSGKPVKPPKGDIPPFFENPTVDDSGNVTIEASPEVMGQIPPGRYEYDIQYILKSSTGLDTHRTILFGAFSVIDDVSRKVRKRKPPGGGGGYNGGGYNGGGYNGNDTSFPPREERPQPTPQPRRRTRRRTNTNLL